MYCELYLTILVHVTYVVRIVDILKCMHGAVFVVRGECSVVCHHRVWYILRCIVHVRIIVCAVYSIV